MLEGAGLTDNVQTPCVCAAYLWLPCVTGEANNLQSLVQQLLEMLQAASSPHKPQHLAGSSGSSRYANRAIGPTPAAGEWQCSTAAVVAVLSEVLFGASPAWQPPLALTDTLATQPAASDSGSKGSSTSSASKPAGQQLSRMPESDASFEAVLLEAVTAAVKPRLWSLPTSQPVSAAAAGEAGKQHEVLPAQVCRSVCCYLLQAKWSGLGTTPATNGTRVADECMYRHVLAWWANQPPTPMSSPPSFQSSLTRHHLALNQPCVWCFVSLHAGAWRQRAAPALPDRLCGHNRPLCWLDLQQQQAPAHSPAATPRTIGRPLPACVHGSCWGT